MTMGFVKVIFQLAIFVAVANIAVSSQNVTNILSRLWYSVVHFASDFIQKITVIVQYYCPKEVIWDVTRTVNFTKECFQHLAAAVKPAATDAMKFVTDALNSLHDKGISYTDEFLKQLFGVEVIVLADHASDTQGKFLSFVLFIVWLLIGLVSMSRMSYKKFFILMSSTFLLHTFFGSLWCVRRVAFLFGVCLWIRSLVTRRPIPAIFAVLVVLVLTRLRTQQKKAGRPKESKSFQELNNNIEEQRLQRLERKMDLLMAKIEYLLEKIDKKM